MKVVVDASVAIKWFVPEIHWDAAARLLEDPVQRIAPDLIGPELGNILWKKMRQKELTRDTTLRIMAAFSTVDLVIHPSPLMVPAALELALELDQTVYDCLYLALAIAQNCAVVTADRKFHSAVSASPFAEHVRWVAADSL